MPYPYLEAHNINAAGTTRGTYSQVICPFRNISSAHNAVEIHHSLFEGDRMTFFQILTERGDALDRMRPIRFYNEDPDPAVGGIKLFDGVITDTEYAYVGGDYMALKTNAAGWWRELARMDLHHPAVYLEADNWTVNNIYLDLVRIANDMGVMKQAVYKYDTSKIPEYGTYGTTYYEVAVGTEFVVTNIYEGMKMLTRFLDATVPVVGAAPHAYEFIVRVEALPRTTDDMVNPIDQDDTKTAIYILPFPINQDKATVASFRRFQLEAGANGYNVRRDYHRLANDCLAIGSGFESHQIRTHKILDTGLIDADPKEFNIPVGDQPLSSHYLRVTVSNPQYIPATGTIEFIFEDGANPDITDKFRVNMDLAPGTNKAQHVHFTSERSHDGIKAITGVTARDFGAWTPPLELTIEEVTNDASPHHTAIAGKSLNTYGQAPHTITDLWLNSQARVDLAAGKHCRLYHAPTHDLYAPIISRYVSYDNLIGNTAEFYSPYEEVAAGTDFLVTDAVYGFRGNLITQQLMGMRYEMDWDYDGS